MQNYTKFQKFISFLLIFSILFSFTINIKFFGFIGTIFASDNKYYNIVSIFVEDNIYNDIKNDINIYAKNIQNTLENTKTIIIPTKSDEDPFNIASVNEKLYFEGTQGFFGDKGNSKLIGSVFVGNLPLPVVENDGNYEKTVFPYVDFEDKNYIFNNETKTYSLNTSNIKDPKAEIWHGFISPNTGNKSEDIKEIKDYFTKNNDYYLGEGNFKKSEGILNGNAKEELIGGYEPYVFYYDQFRESKAVNYTDFKAYEGYLQNIEDLIYNRFSKELAEKLKQNYFGSNQSLISQISGLLGDGVKIDSSLLGPTTQNIPDIQTKDIIKNTTKNFIQIFNSASLGEFKKDVHNSGRYNSGSTKVNMDSVPYLVSSIDSLSSAVIKNVNYDLENYIDDLVKKGLSRDISIPDNFVIGDSNNGNSTYNNFLYGDQVKDISNASSCSIYRGSTYNSGTLVEANRGYNINLVQADINKCTYGETNGYWGGNSPLNLNPDNSSGIIWRLKSSDFKNAINPIYDIVGGLKTSDTTKNPDPRNCFDNNLILTKRITTDEGGGFKIGFLAGKSNYQVPINGQSAMGWSCSTTNQNLGYSYNFDYTYSHFPTLSSSNCEIQYLKLDGVNIKTYSNNNCEVYTTGGSNGSINSEENGLGGGFGGGGTTTTQTQTVKTLNFHKISSYITHKSPTADELIKQTKYMVSPNLPIDKDRYIDFISADNTYGKINYPYLFRIVLDDKNEFNIENAKVQLQKYLDNKSKELNDLITAKNPSKLSGLDLTIYSLLKTGNYPTANIDLYKILENKPDKEIEIFGNKKTLSYIDTLIFSIYRNNLNSVSAKYKFVFENYLGDQFGGNNFDFFLPKNKKQYEISYLGASGDSQNMYVKLDPNEKADNPFSDIIANNSILNNYLLGVRSTTSNNGGANFKCAPPEGVPIWQWLPAVICRLKDMLPPKISITNGNCGLNLVSQDSDGGYLDNTDDNKNGINDYLENELGSGSLELKTDSNKYYYNRVGNLEANLLNSSGSAILFDNNSNIYFELQKVEIPVDDKKDFNNTNKKVIFDNDNVNLNTSDAYKDALKYVSFKNLNSPTKQGKAIYSFVTKSSEANITFKASIKLKDQKGNIVIYKSGTKTIQVRGDLFYGTNYKLSQYAGELTLDSGVNSIIASDNQSIFLIQDSNFDTQKSSLGTLNSLSNSKEKLFISLSNKDRLGKDLNVDYPLILKITNKDGNIIKNSVINEITGNIGLGIFKETGTFNIEIKDKSGFIIKKEIDIIPDVAVKIDPKLSTTLMEKSGVITTNVFSIYDKYGNPTVGDSYNVEASISGNSLTFGDGTTSGDFRVYEGFKLFRLKSTSNSGDSSITFKLKVNDVVVDTKTVNVSVVDKINFNIEGLSNQVKVGNISYNFNLKILNSNSQASFNSRAYLISNNAYISPDQEFIDIKDNFGSGSFMTKTRAGEKINLEFKIEGVKDSIYKQIDILPDTALKLNLGLSKSKIEASTNSTSTLYVEVKDRYNNTIWNDNSTQLSISIPYNYSHIIKSNTSTQTVSKGKALFIINGTNQPGTAYFKVSSNPSLSNNKIEIIGQAGFKKDKLDLISGMRASGVLSITGKLFFEEYDLENYRFKYYNKNLLQNSENFKSLSSTVQTQLLNLFDDNNKITISGVGENAGKIETFYFWNKDKITGKKYNGLYTTLLGSNYGDITVKDNLANSILFDKDNRSLAITSTLDNLEKSQEVINIKPDGNIAINNNLNDLSQDISTNFNIINSGDLEMVSTNNTFDNIISKIYFNFKNFNLTNCDDIDLKTCINKNENILALKASTDYLINYNSSNSSLKDKDGNIIFSVSNNGKITKSTFTSLEISTDYSNGFVLDILNNGELAGNLAIKFSGNSQINFIRDINVLNSSLNLQTNGGMVIYLDSRDYYSQKKYLGNSTKGKIGYSISYNDPFASDTKTLNSFSNNFSKGYEDFQTDGGIGWKEDNKTLLSFAAGKSVGEATKDYMSFSLINLGDPVISLKQIKKKLPGTSVDRKFDSSIGYLVSKDPDNISYSTFDYNNDGIIDIAILKRTGFIELLEGTTDLKNFINRGNLVYLSDLSTKSTIQTGDFSGDGYDDIVVLNKNRQPVLLSNNKKDFSRINLNLHLNGIISQIISRDMDLDGKNDLITTDDFGEININYGTSTNGVFTKLKVADGKGVTLNGTTMKAGGAVYFDGLYQIPKDKTDTYLTESQQLLQSQQSTTTTDDNYFNESMVDKLVFTQMNYGTESVTSSSNSNEENKQSILNNLPDLSTLSAGGLEADNSSITDFITNTAEDLNPGNNIYDSVNQNKLTTFIKSEYSEYELLNVEKNYIDENSGSLAGGDIVKLNIKITNNTNKKINNVAYVDKIPDPFFLSTDSLISLNIGGKEIKQSDILLKSSPSDDYTFLLDSYKDSGNEKSISLNPGESIFLGVYLNTNAFTFGFIEVGDFDNTTEHGDIIFKNKNENCGQKFDLYKSITKRGYEYLEKVGVCQNDLPDSIAQNAIDTNNNGIPDYIDDLSTSAENSGTEIVDFAKEKLGEINKDSDGDGVIDSNDSSPDRNNDDDFMNSLDGINSQVDSIMGTIDTISDGLSCGFGGGSCLSMPINAAPLAPGSSIAAFGLPAIPAYPSMFENPLSGFPIFSAMTWCMPIPGGCIPFVWPPIPGGGGGLFFGTLPLNYFRLFITPTLTGAVGVAACFGNPLMSLVYWPPGVHPLVPGGNCIVAAAPLFGCKDDGSDGEIYNVASSSPGTDIVNGNCNGDNNSTKTPYLGDTVKSYLQYKKTGVKSKSLVDAIKDSFSTVAKGSGGFQISGGPLLNINGGGSGDGSFDMSIDVEALKSGNFQDVIKIKMTRISAFPDFIMEWATRQIEEIANKLTDFPTVFVILPDFSGILDSGWKDFIKNLKDSFNKGEGNIKAKQNQIQSQIDAINNAKPKKDCEKDQIGCTLDSLETSKLAIKKAVTTNDTIGGIKGAYEFISTLPMISIQTQKVTLNVPWPDKKTIEKALADFEATKKQWTQELERAQKDWNINNYTTVGNQNSVNQDGNREKIVINTKNLINSIDKNIEILNDYKNFPEKIYKMLKIKEIRLNQVLCYLETITKITGGRIGDNGKRFKTWVELYILIKAILKSWQLLIDLFIDYNASCHQCKNERYDLMYFIWKLISAIIPKIPVIQFPKWPDIYIDLHNIRVQLNLLIPEFELNFRPIVIPHLPRLYLPSSPNVNINIPSLPLLPKLILPELPLLPSIPKIELPNLPPPPKLPKLFSSIEGVLKILKLVTKIMCILKTSPFVPERRAGDQIAFITERGGFLNLDFLDISLPQFSFPFVDAIKITTYVNLEVDIEFLVEMAKQMALPLNTFTNDIVNMLNIGIGDLDFRNIIPQNIDVNINSNGSVNVNTSYKTDNKSDKINIYNFAKLIALNLLKLHETINKDSKIELSNDDFKKEVSKQLANISDEKIVGVWQNTLNYSFSKENKLIDDLIKNNENKWNEVKSIFNEEKEINNNLIKEIDKRLLETPKDIILANIYKIDNSKDYNTRLEKYNLKALNSIANLYTKQNTTDDIKSEAKNILNQVNEGLTSFSDKLDETKKAFSNVKVNHINIPNKSKEIAYNPINSTNNALKPNKLLANNTTTSTTTNTQTQSTTGTCNTTNGGYSYVYKGIYMIEKYLNKKISYLLFDYLDELGGKEVSKEEDFDNDGDKDVIYMVGNEIFIKENLTNQKQVKEYYDGNPLFLNSSDNKFYNNDFIESVNGFDESISSNSNVNIKFLDSTNSDISNYKTEFYEIVDKFDDLMNGFKSTYIPGNIKKYVIDSFRDIDDITIDKNITNDGYIVRKNLAYINNVGNLAGVKLKTKELLNLASDINSNKEITINAGTQIYSTSDSIKLTYYLYKDKDNELKYKDINLNNYSNITFDEDIILVGLTGDAYVEGGSNIELTGSSIIGYVKKPLLPGAKIELSQDTTNTNTTSYISIKYYDDSITDLDFSEVKYYELYDLGYKSDSYLIRTSMENNYYYAKIRSFRNNKFSTYSNQILLSPQIESDNKAPEITNISSIKAPVYQKRSINISDYIFEDSGNNNIKNIYIDSDLKVDSNNNGNTTDDKDYEMGKDGKGIDIKIVGNKIYLDVGPFDKIYNKKVRLSIVDTNNNIGYKDIGFIIYSPIPTITSYENNTLSGKINESLETEPISFYRVRGGNIDKLADKNGIDISNTFNGGNYSFDVGDANSSSGIAFSESGSSLFKIDEYTGKINIGDFEKMINKVTFKVYSSNNKNNDLAYPKIIISKDNIPIYYEYLTTPNSGQVEVVEDFKNLNKIGIYYKSNSNNYDYYSIPLGVNMNAGDLFIYEGTDKTQSPIFKIFKDGRINTLNDGYYLEYDTYDKYIVYNLRKIGDDNIIGKIMIIPEPNYIFK
ncbi:MAG: hypothetical protein PHE25_00425 [Candidatus Gracilibacteria bacterium]|nr:hypothetical protein [Candidatus Gracilibacteria bacterium]